MTLEEFQQLAVSYRLTVQERHKNFWAVSPDGYYYVPIGNPVTLTMTSDEWHSLFSAIASKQERQKKDKGNGE